MSFRTRVAVTTAVGVAVAVALACVVVYVRARATLYDAVDTTLRAVVPASDREFERMLDDPPLPPEPDVRRTIGSRELFGAVQLRGPDDSVVLRFPSDGPELPAVDAATVRREGTELVRTVSLDGHQRRVLSAPVGQRGHVLQVARGIDDLVVALEDILVQLTWVTGLGVVGGVAIGWLVSRQALRPVHAFADAAEHVARTDDLRRRISVVGDDELGRLAGSFNRMLTRLAEARRAQRELIVDASHELRTPIATVRTNVELLASQLRGTDSHDLVMDETVEQMAELTRLVDDLIDLARHGDHEPAFERVRLDALVTDAVHHITTFAPDVCVTADVEPVEVHGAPARLRRAVVALLDNAVKYGAEPIAVTVRPTVLLVRDHGPGVDASELPLLFERFWRSPSARSASGSGLGLAIVRQVAEGHGGSVRAANAPGGGLVVELRFEGRPV